MFLSGKKRLVVKSDSDEKAKVTNQGEPPVIDAELGSGDNKITEGNTGIEENKEGNISIERGKKKGRGIKLNM